MRSFVFPDFEREMHYLWARFSELLAGDNFIQSLNQ